MQLTALRDQRQPVGQRDRRSQGVPNAAARLITNIREGASTSRPSCSICIGFQSANVCNSRSPCWCTRHCTTSCLRIWRKIANLCLSLESLRTAFVRHQHVHSAVNQHNTTNTSALEWFVYHTRRYTSARIYLYLTFTSWRSLIRCCCTSRMEQSRDGTGSAVLTRDTTRPGTN